MTPASGQPSPPERGTLDSPPRQRRRGRPSGHQHTHPAEEASDRPTPEPRGTSKDLYGPDLSTLIETAPAPTSDLSAQLRGYLPRSRPPPSDREPPP